MIIMIGPDQNHCNCGTADLQSQQPYIRRIASSKSSSAYPWHTITSLLAIRATVSCLFHRHVPINRPIELLILFAPLQTANFSYHCRRTDCTLHKLTPPPTIAMLVFNHESPHIDP